VALAALPCNQLSVAALPSNEVVSSFKGRGRPDQLVVSLHVEGQSTVDALITAVASEQNRHVFVCSSPDLPFASADHWCPNDAANPIFADRSAAERLLGIDYLKSHTGVSGAGVNVVIIDQGLNAKQLGDRYADGWAVGSNEPGTARPTPGTIRRSHGMMIARNIREVAPEAKFFDLPLLPSKISDIGAFLSLAHVAFQRMLADIAAYRGGDGAFSGPWILVNPWGIFDTRSEHPKGHYTNNPRNCFNLLVASAVNSGIDVIFAAGNCGQFCPDRRCGPSDRGPGQSIWGANSLGEVLTVGAVRADAQWLGYSAQGPGQSNLDTRKPDLCAASQFCETNDASSINTGTSAACAMAAGVVAALRSNWSSKRVPPSRLKGILRETARKPAGLRPGNPVSQRFGHGILDAKAAFSKMPP